jgi:Ca2+-binding RTX toxin-like protein
MAQIDGTDGDDYLEGTELADTMFGYAGHDFLAGSLGDDQLDGGDGEDFLFGFADDDFLFGAAGDDQLLGSVGNDRLSGGDGNDFLKGGSGKDSYDGGGDDPELSWDSLSSTPIGDRISFYEAGADEGVFADLRTGIVYNDGFGNRETMTGIESLSASNANIDRLYGNDGANFLALGTGDTLKAFGGDDILHLTGAAELIDGGDGIDTLQGILGTKLVDEDGDGYAETVANEGGVTIDLAAGTILDAWGDTGAIARVEHFGGSMGNGDDLLTGDGNDNVIRGFGGVDRIDGGAGSDTVSFSAWGYQEHYVYHGRSWGAVEVDLAAGYSEETALKSGTVRETTERFGRDTLIGIENVIGTGLGDRLLGDDSDNIIAPGAGNDFVDGRGGSDTVDYGAARAAVAIDLGAKTAEEAGSGAPPRQVSWTDADGNSQTALVEADDAASSRDRLLNIENAIGSSLADRLAGSAGANRLDGGRGNDALGWSGGGDALVGGAGLDTADYSTAGAAVTIDLAAGTGSVSGQSEVDTLTSIENALGTAFADRLVGNRAANRLDGGAGIDRMEGGAGNDVYVVDDRRDAILDTSGADRIETGLSFTLADGIEQLLLTGEADLSGTGNAAANRLTGNAGANRLDGRGGADAMAGAAGNDVYVVDAAGDRVTEIATGGTDRVEASVSATLARNVENLTLSGDGDIDGTGNAAANILTGNGGDNVLAGGGAADRLSGGAGRDAFLFDTALRTAGIDTILDFTSADDTIQLDQTMFAGLADTGTLRLAAFRQGTEAQDDSDRILYDQATGRIFYDTDGNGDGAAILLARVDPGTALTNADFVVVA